MNNKRLWKKILPFPLGTKVRISHETISTKDSFSSFEGRTGVISGYCAMDDKEYLVEIKAFPRTIIKEIMYLVTMEKDSVELIFRDNELEVIESG